MVHCGLHAMEFSCGATKMAVALLQKVSGATGHEWFSCDSFRRERARSRSAATGSIPGIESTLFAHGFVRLARRCSSACMRSKWHGEFV